MKDSLVALITGVSRREGLGFETARQLAGKGYQVIITARNGSKAEELARILSRENLDVQGLALNILDEKQVAHLASNLNETHGRLDVLINNAGGYYDAGADPLTVDFDFLKEALDTNLMGSWRMIKHFIALLRKSKAARVVNVSSGAASYTDSVFGFSNLNMINSAYGISKLALNGLTVKMANRLKKENIKVNAICPGWVATYPGTAEMGARPVEDGAAGIVWAATLPDDGPTGGFFRDGKPLGW